MPSIYEKEPWRQVPGRLIFVRTMPIFFPLLTARIPMSDILFRFYPYTLELRHPFSIAGSSRSTTPVMLVELEKDGIVGCGEASMPPYLGESHATAQAFFSRLDFTRY